MLLAANVVSLLVVNTFRCVSGMRRNYFSLMEPFPHMLPASMKGNLNGECLVLSVMGATANAIDRLKIQSNRNNSDIGPKLPFSVLDDELEEKEKEEPATSIVVALVMRFCLRLSSFRLALLHSPAVGRRHRCRYCLLLHSLSILMQISNEIAYIA